MGKSRRLELSAILKEIIDPDYTSNVYFQPGPDFKMSYPCFVYERDNVSAKHADNMPYSTAQRYQVTYIDSDPDSDVIDKLNQLEYCAFNRHFATSGLNHDVYVIYH